jgi:hypothetical protein
MAERASCPGCSLDDGFSSHGPGGDDMSATRYRRRSESSQRTGLASGTCSAGLVPLKLFLIFAWARLDSILV